MKRVIEGFECSVNIHEVISDVCVKGADTHLHMISGCQGGEEMTHCTESRRECVTFRAATTHTHRITSVPPTSRSRPRRCKSRSQCPAERERERERERDGRERSG